MKHCSRQKDQERAAEAIQLPAGDKASREDMGTAKVYWYY